MEAHCSHVRPCSSVAATRWQLWNLGQRSILQYCYVVYVRIRWDPLTSPSPPPLSELSPFCLISLLPLCRTSFMDGALTQPLMNYLRDAINWLTITTEHTQEHSESERLYQGSWNSHRNITCSGPSPKSNQFMLDTHRTPQKFFKIRQHFELSR